MAEGFLYVGSYTHVEPHAPLANGRGIVAFSFDDATGTPMERHVYRDFRNASYLAHDTARGLLFVTSESATAPNEVHAFAIQPDGSLLHRGGVPVPGLAACHVCVIPPHGEVGVATYMDARLCVFPVQDGRLGPPRVDCRYRGTGPNHARQEAAHAHQVVVAPDGRWITVCDLGADRVWIHAIGADGHVREDEPTSVATVPGNGPRHLAFHPRLPLAYVIGELSGRLEVFDWDAMTGSLRPVAVAASCPDRRPEEAACAAIRVHPGGRALYVSDRRDGAIVAFELDGAGHPRLAGRYGSGGATPRDLAVAPSGRWLVVGNQESDTLAVFELDAASGAVACERPRTYPVRSPSSLLFIAPPTPRPS